MTSGGLPHSGTRGSTPADGSPRLVAAFRALHRPSTPRHPPCARRSSAIALAHDHEPTGSTHVHHSALVKGLEALRASSEPSTVAPRHGRCLARTPPQPNKKRPTSGRTTCTLARRYQLFIFTVTSARIAVSPVPLSPGHQIILSKFAHRLSRPRELSGGDGRIRTPDLPRARRALSH